jgi:outer membrane cobalamin receptor
MKYVKLGLDFFSPLEFYKWAKISMGWVKYALQWRETYFRMKKKRQKGESYAQKAFICLLGSIVLIVGGQSVGAQKNAQGHNGLVLPEIVVTGTKFPTEIERVPGRIDVLDTQEIKDMPYERVDELLQQLFGVQTSRTDGIFKLSPQVTMRGLGGNVPARTLVLIDGMPTSVGYKGNFRWGDLAG